MIGYKWISVYNKYFSMVQVYQKLVHIVMTKVVSGNLDVCIHTHRLSKHDMILCGRWYAAVSK